MDEAKDKAQKAIEKMYDAERDAELARLEAAAAKATLGAIEKTKWKIMQEMKQSLKRRKQKKIEKRQENWLDKQK